MTKPSPNQVIIATSIILSVMVLAIACWRLAIESHRLYLRTPVYDEVLSPKVCAYFDGDASERKGSYDSYGNLLYGPTETYCNAAIYGHDENYIYALVTRNGFMWFYHYQTLPGDENTIRITRSVARGMSWSSHIRLRYQPGTDFKIIGYDQPSAGALYYEELTKMFATMMVPAGEADLGKKREPQDLRKKFRSEHADDPYPDKIERIYTSRNPKIIIGGEVED